MYKVTFDSFSFGCRVNEAEKTAMDKGMIEAGFVQDKLNPDIYIINTCAVTAKAEREARQLILTYKRKNPKLKIVATGCSATYWEKNGLWKNIPIDLLISNINKEYAIRLIQKRLFAKTSHRSNYGRQDLLPSDKFLDSGRVMVKIQDGCNRFCSYCIVPYLRGLPKSRKTCDIVGEVKRYENNMQEAVLTAINTEAFGMDTGETLTGLIERLLLETEIQRISFGSIHPWSISGEFLQYYNQIAYNCRFSNFFHVPLQSGSDKMLHLMKRDYKRAEMMEKLNDIQKINAHALIATDIIVGFLEETDRDFEDTYSFLEKSPVSKFHIFRFSVRRNTAAFYLSRKLEEPDTEVKKRRSKALHELQRRKYGLFQQKQVGTESEALFYGKTENGYLRAILNNQLPAFIKSNQSLSGCLKRVTITELKKGCLIGKVA